MNHVILVLDDGHSLTTLRNTLEAESWSVHATQTPEETFEGAKRYQPDLIVLHGELAGPEAETLAMHLKLDPVTCAIPIMVIRATGSSAGTSESWVADTLELPLNPPLLLAKLQRLLSRRQTQHPYVLVVDDEPDLVEIMTLWLDEHGFLTSSATNGTQALEIARAVHPDAILLDVDMPQLNGWQVLEQLKHTTGLADIRVVILTGVATTDRDRQAGLSHGADAYLLKPCQPDDVTRALQSVLHSR